MNEVYGEVDNSKLQSMILTEGGKYIHMLSLRYQLTQVSPFL